MAKTLEIITVFLLLGLCSCDSSSSKSISKFIDDASSKVAPVPGKVSELTQDELSKLFTFEYKVLELDSKLTSDEIEAKLTDLGKEMWDCFAVTPSESVIKLFCKRRPKTYLRYIPRWF